MEQQARGAQNVSEAGHVLAAEPPRIQMHGWMSVGEVRVTAGEYDLLRTLITLPELQGATNTQLEELRAGRLSSTVATDIDELEAKGQLIVHGSNAAKRGHVETRTLRPTTSALEGMALL